MDITIKTKFDIGDVVFAFFNGHIVKYCVREFKFQYNSSYLEGMMITYECNSVPERETTEDGYPEEIMVDNFNEYELHTKDEIVNMLKDFIANES